MCIIRSCQCRLEAKDITCHNRQCISYRRIWLFQQLSCNLNSKTGVMPTWIPLRSSQQAGTVRGPAKLQHVKQTSCFQRLAMRNEQHVRNGLRSPAQLTGTLRVAARPQDIDTSARSASYTGYTLAAWLHLVSPPGSCQATVARHALSSCSRRLGPAQSSEQPLKTCKPSSQAQK